MLGQVERFQREVLGAPVPLRARGLEHDEVRAFSEHMGEEMVEFQTAATAEEQADALVDIAYIALGRLIRMGVTPGPAFDTVHEANMRKKPGRVDKRPEGTFDAIKPAGWDPPDLRPYLELTREDLLRALIAKDAEAARARAERERLEEPFDPEEDIHHAHGRTAIPKTGVAAAIAAGVEVRLTNPDRPGTVKLDDGKAPVWRGVLNYFPRALYGVAHVSGFGAEKYKEWGGFTSVADALPRYSDALARHQLDEAIGDPLPEPDAALIARVRTQYRDATPRLVHAFQQAWNALARAELMVKNHDY
jgi:predicted HAD superfamily Cof-like phosphohydrolase